MLGMRKWLLRMLWLSPLAIVGAVVVFLFMAAWAHRRQDFMEAPNLRSLGIALKMYAADSYYPPLSPRPGHLMFEQETMTDKYLDEPQLLFSYVDPAWPDVGAETSNLAYACDHSSYYYLGYQVWNDETVKMFADAYRSVIQRHGHFDGDLPVQGPIERLTRLDDALRRHGMLTEDEARHPRWEYLRHSDAEIPCLIEKPHLYYGPVGIYFFEIPLSRPEMGGAVAYKDGHVEYIPYPGKWPMTQTTIETLQALEKLRAGP